MNLSKHFTLEEFIASDTAARLHIDNMPSDEEIEKLRWLAGEFEVVREKLGPLHCNSVFRCHELNHAIGSSDSSQHIKCEAGDLVCLDKKITPYTMCVAIQQSTVQFDQLIYEYGNWMHISFVQVGKRPRRQVLTINKNYPRGTLGILK